jgi:hypothetical protein
MAALLPVLGDLLQGLIGLVVPLLLTYLGSKAQRADDLAKLSEIQHAQLDAAARGPACPDSVLERMRSGAL